MIKQLLDIWKAEADNLNDRRLRAAQCTALSAFTIGILFTLYNFFDNNPKLFFLDLSILSILLLSVLLFARKGIYMVAGVSLAVMTAGLLLLIHINQGQDNVALWSIVVLFYATFTFGYRRGIQFAGIFLVLVFILLFNWAGEHYSYQGYIRFIAIALILLLIAYSYERSIHKTLLKLEKANLKLAELCRTDPLTGLYNRRDFNEQFPKQRRIAERNNNLQILLIADIDHFKGYNDLCGHQAGDNILKAVATSLQHSLNRPNDLVFRLGGEEFGLLWQAQTEIDALHLAEQVKDNIEQLKIHAHDEAAHPYLTISAGLYAIHSTDQRSCDEIFRLCDEALYRAKHRGRNRIEAASHILYVVGDKTH